MSETPLQDLINHPGTYGWGFVAEGPDGQVVAHGENAGGEETLTKLCSMMMVQCAGMSEKDSSTFFHDVIKMYNEQNDRAEVYTGGEPYE